MRISDFSKKHHISIDTLRYYDRLGILVPKRQNNQRVYEASDQELLKTIETLKSAQFSLEEIKRIFEMEALIEAGHLDELNGLKDLFKERLEVISLQVEQLNSAQCMMKKSLKKLEHLDQAKMKEIMEATCS